MSLILTGIIAVRLLNATASAAEFAAAGTAWLHVKISDPHNLLQIPVINGPVFTQRVESESGGHKLVTIATTLHPVVSRKAYHPQKVTIGELNELTTQITTGTQYIHQASKAILDWVGSNIVYQPPDGVEESPASVLAAKQGSCVGRTLLAVDLCQNAGIEAREVRGYLFDRTTTNSELHGQFHRWLETRVPDVGWLPSDPGYSVHFVDPFHLICSVADKPADPGQGVIKTMADLGISCTLQLQYNDIIEVDGRCDGGLPTFFYRLDRTQSAAVIAGSVQDEHGKPFPMGTAVLRDGHVNRRRALSDAGRFSFPAIPARSFSLTIEIGNRSVWTIPIRAIEHALVFREIILASELRTLQPSGTAVDEVNR